MVRCMSIAHFYSAYGETTLSDELLIRQLVQSLKGSTFTWYTQLQPESIQTWDGIQRAFLAQFVNSKAKVSIMDLANAYPRSIEFANDFISRLRSSRLQCLEKLSEQACVHMCTTNLLPELVVHVGSTKPTSFDALVSKASNVKCQLARDDIKKSQRKVETMTTSIRSSSKSSTEGNPKAHDKGESREQPRKPTLEERRQEKYPFNDDDVLGIF
ncbi:hypothetical protein V2J09_021283 [Rumex salicifolius]